MKQTQSEQLMQQLETAITRVLHQPQFKKASKEYIIFYEYNGTLQTLACLQGTDMPKINIFQKTKKYFKTLNK